MSKLVWKFDEDDDAQKYVTSHLLPSLENTFIAQVFLYQTEYHDVVIEYGVYIVIVKSTVRTANKNDNISNVTVYSPE